MVLITEVVLILIIIISTIKIIIHLLKLESLASVPVDGTGNKLLLDIFTDLVIKLETLFDIRGSIINLILITSRWRWRSKEVEEALSRDCSLNNPSLLRVYYFTLALDLALSFRKLTLVALLLALNTNSQVLSSLPVNLITFSVIIDEITSVSALLLVKVCLGDLLVGEKFVLSKLEDKLETRLVKISHADVSKRFEGRLVPVGDGLGESEAVLHGSQPELWNTLEAGWVNLLLILGLLLLLLIIFVIRLGTSLDLLLSGFGESINNLGTLLV